MSKSHDQLALAASIAETIGDYREGEITVPSGGHVTRWAKQFGPAVRGPLLAEVDYVLKKTYFSKARVEEFLNTVIVHDKLTGGDPRSFWSTASLLDIQLRGDSQRDMLRILRPLLGSSLGVESDITEADAEAYIYIDDVIFTGNHVRRDLEAWVRDQAPDRATVHVIVMGLHEGSWYARKELKKSINTSGKSIDVTWWRSVQPEDRKAHINRSDVLRPRSLPNDVAVKKYAQSLSYEPVLRSADSRGAAEFFSSEDGRHLLEQEFLRSGVSIRHQCTNLPEQHRPLGYHSLRMLGFGSLLVTYRNCPNNAPLVFWVDAPWYPLFPRRTN